MKHSKHVLGSELYTSLWQWKALVQRKKALTKLYHKYRQKKADSEDVRKLFGCRQFQCSCLQPRLTVWLWYALLWCFLRFEIDFLHKHAGCSLSGQLKAQVRVPIVKCRWHVIPSNNLACRLGLKAKPLAFFFHPKKRYHQTGIVASLALLVKCRFFFGGGRGWFQTVVIPHFTWWNRMDGRLCAID